MRPRRYSRRTILKNLAIAGIGSSLAGCGRLASPLWDKGDPFTLGVASGSPSSNGFVIWTRLAPDPLRLDGTGGMSPRPVNVHWEVASDDTMRRVVAHGTAQATPASGHAVHVQLKGLEPGRPYWYRFTQGNAVSRTGRSLTLPAAGTPVDRLKLGYVSCANYELGYFSAYRHLADEAPDLVLYLGDYFYERVSNNPKNVRRISERVEADSLSRYRNRYAQYQLDPDLQRLRAEVPALITWDDHEVDNDYAGVWSQDFEDPARFLRRRAAAYQAFYENMPLKPTSRPNGPNMHLYDSFDYGTLTRIAMIDGRQYRSREACTRPGKGGGHVETRKGCPSLIDPARTFLGNEQEAWLFDTLANSHSQWNIIGNDVMMAQFKQWSRIDGPDPGFWTDDWNGYQASRKRLMQHLHNARVANPVVVTGDIHSWWANDLKLDFDDPGSVTVGTEFVGSSVTSDGPPYERFLAEQQRNPHMHYFDSRTRGYSLLDITPGSAEVKFRAVSDVRDPGAGISTQQAFHVESGRPGVQSA